jgi:sporulation protein YlmC with PRC-barrel domain
MRLSQLLSRKVVTESGEPLGRIHDLRGQLTPGRLVVTGLAAGSLGLLERYGVGTGGNGGPTRAKVHGHVITAWSDVLRIHPDVLVRDPA